MSWFPSHCDRHRGDLSLLASRVLEGQERTRVENHLVTCARCQEYYDDLKRLAEPMAKWEEAFSHIEANEAIQDRWAKDFTGALKPVRRSRILDLWHEIIWPCRGTWAGFAAVWLAILGFNFTTRDEAGSQAMKGSRPSPEMVRAYLEGEGFLAEWARRDKSREAESAKPVLPAPRSEGGSRIFRT